MTIFTSPKTTISGIVLLLTGLGALGKILNDFISGEPINFEQVGLAVGSISAGMGLIWGRDNTTSSQDAGIR